MTESQVPGIIIVMGTYNGAEFLREQIDSLINQTEPNWVLLVRDDGSKDRTPDILKEYAAKDSRIRLCSVEGVADHSALGNFSILLKHALSLGGDYIFCCDQDDVWAAEKLQRILIKLQDLEGVNKDACLIHHDLAVVDKRLNLIDKSFVRMMRINPGDENKPQRLVSRNEVTGCAMACNRALLKLALPISGRAVMHDWWLAMFAAFFGKIRFEPIVLVQYRQHHNNVIGAKSFFSGVNPFTNWIKGWHRGDREFMETIEQARAFTLAVEGEELELNAHLVRKIDLYCSLPSATRLQRFRSLKECNLWRSHWILNMLLIVRMLLLPRTPQK